MLSLNGLYEFFETLLQRGQWVAFAVGIVAGGGLGSYVSFRLCRQFMPSGWKGKYEATREQHDDLVHRFELVDQALEGTKNELASATALVAQQDFQIQAAKGTQTTLKKERNDLHRSLTLTEVKLVRKETELAEVEIDRVRLEARFTDLLKVGTAKRWDQPAGDSAPKFRPLAQRQMTIISVLNLKGGVGKTTITANLGAMLAKEAGLRVLMIDLDHQGSLSIACLSPQELADVYKSQRLVSDILRDGVEDRTKAIFQCATRLEDREVGTAHILAANDELERVESQVMAHWLLGIADGDIRFRLREALHAPEVSDEYDIVLIDCPPRLSTGCVNALAASDYVLSPVLLEPISIESPPRLLKWLKNSLPKFCPELMILGMVANRVRFSGPKLISKQARIWDGLKGDCRSAWGGDIHFFEEQMLRQHTGLERRLVSLAPEHAASWKDLTKAILKELPPYARRGPATVHPVPTPPIAVGRG